MAEKETINIVQLQIKEEDVIKKLTELKTVIDSTRKSTKELEAENKKLSEAGQQNSQAYKDNAVQIEKNKAQVKGLSTEYSNNQKILVSLNQDQNNNLKSINDLVARNKALRQERNNVNIKTKEGHDRIKELNKEIDANDKLIKDNNDNLVKQKINIGNYGSALQGLPGPLGAGVAGFKALTKSALAFIATPIGLILGVIAAALYAVKAAFTSSEEGQNKYNKLMTVLGALLGNVKDVIADVGELLINAFENPKQSLKDLGEFLKNQLINRFKGLLELIPALGKAVGLLFKGKFKEAGEVAVNAAAKVGLGVENITDKTKKSTEAVKKYIKEQGREAELAVKVADARAKADLIDRKLTEERAEIEARVAELRLKAREEDKYSAEERQKYLEEARVIQDKLLDQELESAKLRAYAIETENKFARSTKENLDAEAEARAKISQIETNRFNQARQIQRELTGVSKQAFNEKMAMINAEIQANKKRVEAEIELQKEANDLFNEIDAEQADEFLKSLELNEQNKLELLNQSIFGQIEAERQKLETQKQMEIEAAEAIGADVNLINQKYANAEIELNRKTLDTKLDLASQAFSGLAQLFGENTKVAKAAQAAQVSIDSIKGAISAYSSLAPIPYVGPVLGGIAAAASIAAGVKAVRDIYAVKSGLPGDSSGGGSSVPSVRVSGISGTSSANINDGGVVSRSMGTNSIKEDVKNGFSEALKENPLQPTLVVDEVTSKQTESKYIVNTATI